MATAVSTEVLGSSMANSSPPTRKRSITRASHLAHRVSHRSKCLVTRGVADPVVDELEVVEVHEHEGEVVVVLLDEGQLRCQLLVEGSLVAQAREPVAPRVLARLLVHRFQIGPRSGDLAQRAQEVEQQCQRHDAGRQDDHGETDDDLTAQSTIASCAAGLGRSRHVAGGGGTVGPHDQPGDGGRPRHGRQNGQADERRSQVPAVSRSRRSEVARIRGRGHARSVGRLDRQSTPSGPGWVVARCRYPDPGPRAQARLPGTALHRTAHVPSPPARTRSTLRDQPDCPCRCM